MRHPAPARALARANAIPSLAIGLWIAAACPGSAGQSPGPCVDSAVLSRSVVSITHYLGTPRREWDGEVIGERATAWFYVSPRLLVTAAHFAARFPEGWDEAELRQSMEDGRPDVVLRVRVRVLPGRQSFGRPDVRTATTAGDADDVAILELERPFPSARVLEANDRRPEPNETVLVLGYPGGRKQAAPSTVREGRQASAKFAGLAFIEVQGTNRFLLNAGSSGSPVLDCRDGSVLAVLNGLLTGPSLPFLPPDKAAVPTPWGSPTNTAVPASLLNSLRERLL